MLVNVQFADSSSGTVVTYLCTAQDPAVFENQGEVDVTDPRWHAFYERLDAYAQQAVPVPA